jgi:hypothetical protein
VFAWSGFLPGKERCVFAVAPRTDTEEGDWRKNSRTRLRHCDRQTQQRMSRPSATQIRVGIFLFSFVRSFTRAELQRKTVFLRSVLRLLVTANVVPSSPILVTLMMEALRSSETSVLTRATRRNNVEDGILHSHRRENLKSYIALTG